MAIGLALLVVILPQAGGAHSTYSHAGMIAFEAGLLFVAVMLVLSPKLGTPRTITTASCSASRRASCSASPTSPSRP